ncbi:flavodoxin family protein [Microcoleus sp. herbarium14]|uniref:flavodoxin family protein n=1 Tax=Microcoleus sp. herbarium14 TaxID=3055439 RepID=UPI002FD503C8
MSNLRIAIVYHSENNHVAALAQEIQRGVLFYQNIDAIIGSIDQVSIDILPDCHSIIIGCPTYFANISSKMKAYLESTLSFWENQSLSNKIGASFTVSGGICGDKVLALNMLNHFMLMHGMIIVGNAKTKINTDIFNGLGVKTQRIEKHGSLFSIEDAEKAFEFGKRISYLTLRFYN